MKKCLVLGAGGFIGSHLVKKLKEEGCYVRGVDLKYPEHWETFADEFLIYDLRNPIHVEAIMRLEGTEDNNPLPFHYYPRPFSNTIEWDEAYQLAADMGGAGYIFTGENDANVMHNSALINLNVTHEAVKQKVKRIFYSSSACMYPAYNQLSSFNPDCKESSAYPAAPDSEYGWEKLFSERLYLAFNRNYGLDVRIARFHNIFGPCFDNKTEVLTIDGWKFFKDVTLEDRIASLDINKNLIYLNPKQKQEYPYKGKMYKVKNKFVNQVVTPNHKLYVSKHTKKGINFELIETETLEWSKGRLYFTSKCNWEGNVISDYFEIPSIGNEDDKRSFYPSKKVKMKDWFEFIGWYISEGSKFKTPSNYSVVISQQEEKNKEYRNEIKNLLNRMDIHFYEEKSNHHLIICNKQIYECLEEIGIGAVNKKIPNWMLQAPSEFLQIMLNSLMKGDGNKRQSHFCTVSPYLRDQVMEIAIKLGKYTSYSLNDKIKKENHNQSYKVLVSNKDYHITRPKDRTIIDYDGFVYDVTLPENNILMIRRDNKISWSGNCGTWQGGKEKAPAAICRKVAEALMDDEIEIWGDGEQTRSFLYIDECIEAILRFMRQDEFMGPVNIGSEEMITINELAEMVMDIADKHSEIKNITGQEFKDKYGFECPQGVRGRNSDNKLYKEKMGWEPTKPLNEGLMETYKWVNQQVN